VDSYPPLADSGSTPDPATGKGSLKGLFMFYTVYILFSEEHNKHYTGFTSNMELRLRSHNEFGKGWTARYRPWKIIYRKEFTSKKEAMDYERWLKSGLGRDFIKSLPH
jgi:putative endonuclease